MAAILGDMENAAPEDFQREFGESAARTITMQLLQILEHGKKISGNLHLNFLGLSHEISSLAAYIVLLRSQNP
jgi:hypothetical protein